MINKVGIFHEIIGPTNIHAEGNVIKAAIWHYCRRRRSLRDGNADIVGIGEGIGESFHFRGHCGRKIGQRDAIERQRDRRIIGGDGFVDVVALSGEEISREDGVVIMGN